jgi:hypothetical protein
MVLTSILGQNNLEKVKYSFPLSAAALAVCASSDLSTLRKSFKLKAGRFLNDLRWFFNGFVTVARIGGSASQYSGEPFDLFIGWSSPGKKYPEFALILR